MTRTVDLPYGAFELKSRYQRNMFLGTLSAALLTTMILGTVWIYTIHFQEEAIPVLPPPPPIRFVDTLIFIPPPGPPTDPGDLPGGIKGILPPPPSQLRGNIIIIDSLSPEEETGIRPPAENGIYGKYDPKQEYDTGGGTGTIGPDPGGIYIPDPGEFIPHEIEPVIIFEEMPVYPRIPQEAGFTGWVIIQAFVDNRGNVKKAEAVRCNRPNIGFEEEAVKAALKCKYSPAIQNGDAVGVWIAYKVEFKF